MLHFGLKSGIPECFADAFSKNTVEKCGETNSITRTTVDPNYCNLKFRLQRVVI